MSHDVDNRAAASSTGSRHIDDLLDQMERKIDDGEIPLSILHDDSVFQMELERIFANSWMYVGHESEIPEPGDYRRRSIGTDPFLFVRDEHDDVRVFFNSCRHRASKLGRAEKGNTTHFRCPYHGWTYRNTGELVGVPRKGDGFDHIDPCEKGMLEATQVDSYHGLVFATMSATAPDLETYLGDAAWYLDMYFSLIDMEVLGDPHRWEVDIDWKVPTENFYGDNYHVQMGHKSAIDVGIGSDTATGKKSSKLYSISDVGGHSFSIYQIESDEPSFWGHPEEVVETFHPDRLSEEQYEVAYHSGVSLGSIFPNLSFIHLGGTNDPKKDTVGTFCLRQWQPIAPGKMEVWNWIMAPADAPESYKRRVYEAGMGTFSLSGNFEADDIGIWRGIDDAAESVFARKNDVSTVLSMGMGENAAAKEVHDWPGPGTIHEPGDVTDANQLEFYKTWLKTMKEGV